MASSSASQISLLFVVFVGVLLLSSTVVDGFASGLKLPSSRARSRGRQWTNLTLSVSHFGARGDGCGDDTQAFVEAWKRACSSRALAVIEIPADYVCLIRPIQLGGPCKGKITLLVSGTIIAPSDPDAWNGLDPHKWLYFHGVKDFVVTGGGIINGRGQEWWASSCKKKTSNPCRHAPTAVTFHRIKRLRVHDLTLINSQQMHMAFTACSLVKASHLQVIAPGTSPNTDGIHISSCTSITIEESMIKTGDDCISIVGNSSDILVRNIICGPGHGISIGSLGKSNSTAKVQKVQVDGAFISNTENGVRIKTWQGGQGYARNIMFKNILMSNVSNPIIIDQYYCDSKHPCENQTSAVRVYDIAFIGIKGTSATEDAIKFACSDIFPCENINLEDIQLSLGSGGVPTAYCWQASGSSSGDVVPPSCLSSVDSLIEQNVVVETKLHSMFR
ncbi:uncharacterized protein A4U43_C03F30410 [Asparagus officinalis]|uniref:endo-polygalacturonase n=1 Tax=Asparagus officinalis TaxID=4686 RepID=A0A5P1FGV8_ASPOF|nr:probable polygalacturonase At1g80170 isoform X2 [Asparagus officinalis]ONK76637.1 uncharacterized protein A4U43_C03F30410 [Asparagus officinalis]